mmetsp:Transcript_5492/g.8778  ORF Transcript_5492/g.8778 Transcript_5492/m.8778 type:complete len:309 (-) Transcript_5492:78-1004(-)
MLQVSLDLLVTAIVNVLLLAIGACYVLRNGDKSKDLSANLAKSAVAQAGAPVTAEAEPTSEAVAEIKNAAFEQDGPSSLACDAAESGSPLTSDSAAGAALAAAPDEAALQKSAETYRGTVKRFSQKNGMGFITCDATRISYNIDVRIFRDEFNGAGLQVGDAVEFHTVLGGRAGVPRQHPWATGVRKLDACKDERSAAAAGGLRDEPAQNRGSSLRAAADIFVPATAASGSRLNAAAAEFVPGAPVGTAVPSDVSNGGLNANAAEFVPTSAAVADCKPVDFPHTGLRADADEYIPSGACVWNEDYVEE